METTFSAMASSVASTETLSYFRVLLRIFFESVNSWHGSLVTLVIVVVSVMIILTRKFRLSANKKAFESDPRIPSLPGVPLLGALPWLFINGNDFVGYSRRIAEKFGSIFQTKVLGKNVVVMNNPTYLHKLLSSSEDDHLKKPSMFVEALFPSIASNGILSTSDIPQWRFHRKIIAKAFTYEALKKHVKIFNKHALQFQQNLRNINGNTLSLHKLIHIYTFKDIAEILLGADFLTEEECKKFDANYERCKEIVSFRIHRPYYYMTDLFWNLHPHKKLLDMCMNELIRLFNTIIKRQQDRNAGSKEPIQSSDNNDTHFSILELLVSAGLSNQELYSESSNIVLAGQDTVSITMNYLFMSLSVNPEIQKKCQEEVDRVCESYTDLDMNALSELKYLEMCIKETTRMFPVINLYGRDLSGPLDLDNDLRLEAGTFVIISPLMIHQNPSVYPDPDTFDPERFAPENCVGRSNYDYLPFSMGPRNCIGWKMAIAQMKVYAAYILKNFDVYTENTMENVMKLRSGKMWPDRDLGTKCRPRHTCSSG